MLARAHLSLQTDLRRVERMAFLDLDGFALLLDRHRNCRKLLLPMRELAISSIRTETIFAPVLADVTLVLACFGYLNAQLGCASVPTLVLLGRSFWFELVARNEWVFLLAIYVEGVSGWFER